jgi:hypothetical protein
VTGFSRIALFACVTFLVVAAITAPSVAYEYDAAGWWIPRAELERAHTGATVNLLRTRETLPLLLPWLGIHRHPIAGPLVVGWLARLAPSSVTVARIAALRDAALLIVLVVLIRRRVDRDANRATLLSAVVLACPYLFVHLRAGYIDLTVGAAAALFVIAMMDALQRPRRIAWLALGLAGTFLVQLKLEGTVHAVIGIVAVACCATDTAVRRRVRVAAAVFAIVGINLAAWQLTLRLVPDSPLPPGIFYWDQFRPAVLPYYLFHLVRHAIDYTTWGFVWPLVFAVAVAARRWAALVSFGGALTAFALCYAVGPPVMIGWAASGIQLNRLLLEILIAGLPLVAGVGAPSQPRASSVA